MSSYFRDSFNGDRGDDAGGLRRDGASGADSSRPPRGESYDPTQPLPIDPLEPVDPINLGRGTTNGSGVLEPSRPSAGVGRGTGGGAGGDRGLVGLSESPMPLVGGAAGTNLVTLVALVALIYGFLESGFIGQLLAALFSGLFSVMGILVLLAIVMAILPVILRLFIGLFVGLFGHVVGGVLGGAGAAARGGCLGGRRGQSGGLSLICRTPTDRQVEVRFRGQAHVPAGSTIHVVGPTFLGRRHAWLLTNQTLGQRVVARGVISSFVYVLAALAMWVGIVVQGVR